MNNILIPFYSSYGHTYDLAVAVAQGAEDVDSTTTKLAFFPEVTLQDDDIPNKVAHRHFSDEAKKRMSKIGTVSIDDLKWADGIIWGTPTRFGNMCVEMKHFIDKTGALWFEGALEGKPTGIFTCTGTLHGGQETTLISSLIPMLHHGMIFVGSPYSENPHMLDPTKAIGGTPYGPSTLAVSDLSRKVQPEELLQAKGLGRRVSEVASRLKGLRKTAVHI